MFPLENSQHLPSERRIFEFFRTVLVLAILWLVLLLLEILTEIIKICTKFWVKQTKFLLSKYTSFLRRSKPVQQSYLYSLKKVKRLRNLRVDETKLTSENVLVVNLPSLGSENKSKYGERTLFWGSLHILDLSFNP